MTSLYKQTGEMLELQKMVEGGEMSQADISDTLDGMEMEFNDKANSIVKFAQSFDSDISVIDAEIKRLQERKKVMTNKQNNLKEYLRYNMEQSGITKIKSSLFSITLRKPLKKAEVLDVDFLPDEYVTTSVSIKPDLKKILTALKDGEEINGAILSEGKAGLLIK